jgi:hypothetical protein
MSDNEIKSVSNISEIITKVPTTQNIITQEKKLELINTTSAPIVINKKLFTKDKDYLLSIISNKMFEFKTIHNGMTILCFICENKPARYGFNHTIATHCTDCQNKKIMLPYKGRDKTKLGTRYVFTLDKKQIYDKNYILSILNNRYFTFKRSKNKRKYCIACDIKEAYYGFPDTTSTFCGNCQIKDQMILYTHLPKNKPESFIVEINKDLLFDKDYITTLLNTEGFKFRYGANGKKVCLVCEEKAAISGFPDTTATHCTDHQLKGIMVSYKFPCKCPQGKKEGKRKIYGKVDEKTGKIKATNCIFCKTDDMFSSQPTENKVCDHCNKTRATYGFPGKGMSRCFSCKEDLMEDLAHLSQRCINCKDWVDSRRGIKELDDYCSPCFQQIFPLDLRTLKMHRKTKEIAVRDFINLNYQGFQHDKPLEYSIDCDCTHRRRIDHRKLFGNTMLCIETDEYQHKKYDSQDENDRYHDLFMAFSCKFIFIRFNPDSYIDSYGDNTNPPLSNRLDELKTMIDNQIERIECELNTEPLEVHYLFFDEN